MDEISLMVEIRNGNLDKASQIYDLYHIRIFNFYLNLTQNRDISSDLTQSVFLRVLKYRKSYNSKMEFKAWIYQIARNNYRDHLKKNKILFSGYKKLEEIEDDSYQEIERGNEREQILNKAIKKLPEEMREIIVLSKFQQLKYCEISKILNISVPNVKVRVHRALLKLKENYLEIENK